MSQNRLQNVGQLEVSLSAGADNLRANPKLISGEYSMTVLGVLLLRHATNRYAAVRSQIAVDQAARCRRPMPRSDRLTLQKLIHGDQEI